MSLRILGISLGLCLLFSGCVSRNLSRNLPDSGWTDPKAFQRLAELNKSEFFHFFETTGALGSPLPTANRELEFKKINERSPSEKNILKLYTEFLKNHHSLPSYRIEWRSAQVPSLAEVKTSALVPSPYNTHVIAAQVGSGPYSQFLFRPINSETGCQRYCKRLVFHWVFQIDEKGRLIPFKILEEPGIPLTKLNHERLTQEDFDLILKNTRELNSSPLDWIDHPLQTTNPGPGSHEQTWTLMRPFLIAGGAYTSFKLYEAAQKTFTVWENSISIGKVHTEKLEVSAIHNQDLDSDVETLLRRYESAPKKGPLRWKFLRTLFVEELWQARIKGFSDSRFLKRIFTENLTQMTPDLGCHLLNFSLDHPHLWQSFLRFLKALGERNTLCPGLDNTYLILTFQALAYPDQFDFSDAKLFLEYSKNILVFEEPEFFYAGLLATKILGAEKLPIFTNAKNQFSRVFPFVSSTVISRIDSTYPAKITFNEGILNDFLTRLVDVNNRNFSKTKTQKGVSFTNLNKALGFNFAKSIEPEFLSHGGKNFSTASKSESFLVFYSPHCMTCKKLFFNFFEHSRISASSLNRFFWVNIDSQAQANPTEVINFCLASEVPKDFCIQNSKLFYRSKFVFRENQKLLEILDYQGTPHLSQVGNNQELVEPRIPLSHGRIRPSWIQNPRDFFSRL